MAPIAAGNTDMFAKQWKHLLPIFSLVAVCVLLSEQSTFACPTCQDAVAQNDPTSSGMVSGFFWSILFMLSMPVLILGGLSTYFYFLVLQARAQQAAAIGANDGHQARGAGSTGGSTENADRELVETR